MSARRSRTIVLRDDQISRHVLIVGNCRARTRKAICDHLVLRQFQGGRGAIYIDTTADTEALVLFQHYARKWQRKKDLVFIDATDDATFKSLNVMMGNAMLERKFVYVWAPVDRLKGRSMEALARIRMGIRGGYELRSLEPAKLNAEQAQVVREPFVIADGSTDSSFYFYDAVCSAMTARGSNVGLFFCLPSAEAEKCKDQAAADAILKHSYSRVTLPDEAASGLSEGWRVTTEVGGRRWDNWFPGVTLTPVAPAPVVQVMKAVSWARSLFF